MNVQIEESWKQHLAPEFEKDYFVRLTNFVRQEYQTTTVYPPGRLIFNAFNLCPFDQVKSGDYRTRPLSWSRASTWPLLLGKRWCTFSTLLTEYLQRNTERFGNSYPHHGKSNTMGQPRSTDAQCHTDSTCAPSCFASTPRLGGI